MVDDEDFERVSRHTWSTSLNKKKSRLTCPRTCINYKMVFLSRFLLNAPKGLQVDHINRDVFDNRTSNLRLCTNSTNGHNRGMLRSNKTGYSGVYYDKYHKRYRAEIRIRDKKHFLGYFSNPEDAYRMYILTKQEMLDTFIAKHGTI